MKSVQQFYTKDGVDLYIKLRGLKIGLTMKLIELEKFKKTVFYVYLM